MDLVGGEDISKEIWSEGPNLPHTVSPETAIANNDENLALIFGWTYEVNELQCLMKEKLVIIAFQETKEFKELLKLDKQKGKLFVSSL